MKLSIKRLPEKAMRDWFERPFNPPALAELSGEKWFSDEYWGVHSELCSLLESLGGVADPIDGNFVMNESRGNSRWITVCLVTSQLAKPETLEKVCSFLNSLPNEYAVYFFHEEPAEPLFHLIATKDQVISSNSRSIWLKNMLE